MLQGQHMDSNGLKKTRAKFATFDIKAYLRFDRHFQTYYAYDEAFGHDVVVKVFPASFFADQSFVERFEREIQALVLEDIPGIVPVHDLVRTGDRRYLVREYMSGGSLEQKLASGPLSLEEVVELVGQLATAIDMLHDRGIFHRNLKPANILFDQDGNPFLTDAGQAPPIVSPPVDSLVWELPALHSYSPPEYSLGQEMDWRADVYGLGAVTYAMLSGKPPYTVSPLEQVQQQLSAAAPSLQVIRPDIPPKVSAAVAWAMALSPDLRYDSASSFAAALAAAAGMPWEAEEGPGFRDDKADAQPAPWGFRLGVLTLILLMVIGGLAGVYLGWFDLNKGAENVRGNFVVFTATATETLIPTRTPSPTSSPTRSATLEPSATATASPMLGGPTNTPGPTAAPTSLVSELVLGMADKIAVINNREIYVANLDGTELEQWTRDGKEKSNLQWTPDGRGLLFTVDGCYDLMSYPDKKRTQLGCFGDIGIAPDNVRVVISSYMPLLNVTYRWVSFVSALDLFLQNQLKTVSTVPEKVGCPFYGGKHIRFSRDGEYLAGIFHTDSGDKIQVFQLLFENGTCGILNENEIDTADYIDADRVNLKYYYGGEGSRTMTDFAWNGETIFILHGSYLGRGYGQFVVYYSLIGDPNLRDPLAGRWEIKTPIKNKCCYRDMEFSPDGKYVVFSYVNIEQLNKVELYYVPFNEIGTDSVFTPLNFPEGFFADINEWPQPALRPAIP